MPFSTYVSSHESVIYAGFAYGCIISIHCISVASVQFNLSIVRRKTKNYQIWTKVMYLVEYSILYLQFEFNRSIPHAFSRVFHLFFFKRKTQSPGIYLFYLVNISKSKDDQIMDWFFFEKTVTITRVFGITISL